VFAHVSEEEIQRSNGGEGFLEDFVLEDFYVPEERLRLRRGLDSNTMGLRYPVWHSACRARHIRYTFKSPGERCQGTDFVKLATVSERSSNHPDLRSLPEALTNYLYKFHSYLVDQVCTEHMLHSNGHVLIIIHMFWTWCCTYKVSVY
jgi:hypothetical protein